MLRFANPWRRSPLGTECCSIKLGRRPGPTCVALPTKWVFRCNKKTRILLKQGFGRDQPHRGPFEALFAVTVLRTEAPK